MKDEQYYAAGGRGRSSTLARTVRPGKQPVTVTKEIPHCHGLSAFRPRGPCRDPLPFAFLQAALE